MTKDKIPPMTDEERQRAKERAKANNPYSENKCVSCGNIAATDFCEFCLREE